MTRRSARALLAASWTLAGCNVLVGLDDVNIVQDGKGGAPDSGGPGATGAPDDGTGATTPAGGGTPGTTAQGGATGHPGGAGGAGASPSSGGDPSTSTSGGGGGDTSSSGGDTSSSGGGTTTTSSGGGGDTTTSSSSGAGGSTSSTGGAGGMPGSPCGDGVVVDGEQCDDGNAAPGDGCSDACQVEPFFQCTTTGPSVCAAQEVLCADGQDGDGDGLYDTADPDCALPAYAPAIACSSLRVYRSINVPVAIPDKGAGSAQSVIFVPDVFNVAHTAVLLDVAHPRALDIKAALVPPFGQPRLLTSDNGGGGADYAQTLLDGACAQSVINGMEPFQGCYKPEAPLPANGQPAKGVWALSLEDHITSKTGTLQGWALILCEP